MDSVVNTANSKPRSQATSRFYLACSCVNLCQSTSLFHWSSPAVLVRLCELVMLVLHSAAVNAVWKYLAAEEVLDNNLLVQYLHLMRSCSNTEETIY